MIARQLLERQERRTANGRALVFEAASQQLFLRAEPELADRPVCDHALTEVGGAGGGLELVVPLGPQLRQLALLPLPRESVGLRRGLSERQSSSIVRAPGPM